MNEQELKASTEALFAEQDALQAEMKELSFKYKAKAETIFKELSKAVFKVVPEIKTIAWQQYTPGFNDGDPCTFTLHDVYFSNATTQQIEENDYAYTEDCFYGEDYPDLFYRGTWGLDATGLDKTKQEVLQRFDKFVCSNKDLMESMFGDGVQVVITPKGVSVDEYDCGY